ncbi:M3 family oligoendopeptidase [Treponema sp.]|uniref:M3 family oligoendopeptidase n=1 Tax=Treponema sp. TaxID=166 RepID=UPI0025E2D5ED|nr:M3 family oligoendopeptidase [Treponema sp.]MCR5217944.1 M3 family oligoendopeptidase [Treponema sp.]
MNTNELNNIPQWNLDSIFSSIESPEYKKALEEFESLKNNCQEFLETADRFTREANSNFDFALWLKTYLETEDKLTRSILTLNAYAYIIYSTDTTNTALINNLSKIDELKNDLHQLNIKFSTILVSHQIYLDEFYKRFPEFSEYKYLLEEILEESKHLMSPAEEKLAGELSRTGGNAWGLLQEQIISNLQDKDGKTFNEIRNDAFSSDPQVRKEAWQKEIQLLSQNRIAIAAALNNLKGETLTLNKRRRWDNALDRSLFTSRLSRKTLDALVSVIEDSLPEWRKYWQKKASILKAAGQTASSSTKAGLAFYDLFAPLPSSKAQDNSGDSLLTKEWTFAEARDYIIKEYNSFSSKMGDFAKNAFDSQWIDARVRPGKVGGAYDEDFPKGHQSRILSNFTGTFSDIITLAHELGHAFHFSCLKEKPAAFFSYPMTLAETASTFAETIVKQDMIASCNADDRIKMIETDLQDASQVLVDILCRFYFEESVFDSRKEGELNADDFCRLMKEAQARTYGEGLNEEGHEYMWAVKSHYYSTDFDFYNYPYAFGQLFASGLYALYKKEGSSFADRYCQLLSNTGSMSCEELCSQAGFDITKKDFWQDAVKMYLEEIKEFCR